MAVVPKIRVKLLPQQKLRIRSTPAIPGAAATIEVGTVTTLDAGENATVVNSGSERSAVLDFGIPKGDPGVVQSIVAGDNVTVDDTDPANPIVSSSGGVASDVDFTPSGDIASTNVQGALEELDSEKVAIAATDASGFGFVIDEDDMASDSATKVPTQQSVKAYADTKLALANVIDDDDMSSATDDTVPTSESVKAYADTKAALNADDGLTQASTSTSDDWSGPFGGTWKVSNKLSSTATAIFTGSRATQAITRKVDGSGANGPTNADAALFLSVEKNNYLASTIQGEIDTLVIALDQGRKDDAGGILITGNKVFGTGADTGSLVLIEGSGRKVNSSGVITQQMQTIVNFTEGAGGPSSTTGYGFWTEAKVGTPFAAFHADQTTTSNAAAWTNFLFFTKDRTAASAFFKVDGTGRTYGPNGTAPLPAFSFLSDPDTGMYLSAGNALSFATDGTVRMTVNVTGALVNSSILAHFGTAMPAGGTAGAGIRLSNVVNFGVFFGSGVPTLSAAQGSLYLRSDGSSTSTRMYVNTNGTTGWAAVTTAS